MKKLIVASAIALLPFVAFAHELLDENNNPVVHQHGNGDPSLGANPAYKDGKIVCATGTYYPHPSCVVDLRGTAWYRNQMLEIVRELKAFGEQRQYWQSLWAWWN